MEERFPMIRIGIATAFVILGIVASGSSGSEPRPGELARYPTFGVAFREPKGWKDQLRDKAKTVARWISPDSTPEGPVAMILVECGRTPARSLEDVADGLARSFHGAVADRPTTLGGTRALRVVAKNDGRALRPVEGLVAIHDGLLYLVMGGVTAGHSIADELEAIRASWTWMPIEEPYKHLEFRDEPLSLPGGVATINVPALMHTFPTEHPDRILDLGLHNVRRNEPDFLAYVQILTTAEDLTLDESKKRLEDGLRARSHVKGPIEWRTTGVNPPRVVSRAIEAETTEKADGRRKRLLLRWALVKLDDRRLVSVNFTLPPEAPGDRETYIALVDRIADSIRPGVGAQRVEP
jgi:hypothetical protein